VRVRWHGPDYLGQALAAYRRAIAAYRRLARLAPRHFDTVVIERERRAREEQRRWMASWEPALEKVYGPSSPAEREARRLADLQAEQPPPLPPGIERRVEVELAARQLWLTTGKSAFAQYQQHYPHDLPSLGRVARMLDIACAFGRIATGLGESVPPADSPAPPQPDWEEQLRRAYGRPDRTEVAPPPVSPQVSPTIESGQPSATPPAILSVQPVPPVPPGPAPAVPPPPRRDAWSRLSRQLNQLRSRRK